MFENFQQAWVVSFCPWCILPVGYGTVEICGVDGTAGVGRLEFEIGSYILEDECLLIVICIDRGADVVAIDAYVGRAGHVV